MCNDHEQHIRWKEYCDMMQAVEPGVPTRQTELDLPRADDIRINDMAPIMRAAGNGVELTPMRFSLPPSGPHGGPIFNYRSDGRHFNQSKRCLVPASAFFEFTGRKYPKAKHRFTLNGAPFMAIAGIWRDGVGEAMTNCPMWLWPTEALLGGVWTRAFTEVCAERVRSRNLAL